MGTRADFYAGKGKDAEWLGSIAWDAYRDGIDDAVLDAVDEAGFRSAVAAFLASRDDATLPAQGWPWLWDDSRLTDCSYWFFDGRVWDEHGGRYVPCSGPGAEPDESGDYPRDGERIAFPAMGHLRNVAEGKRSGLLTVTGIGVA